MIDKVLMREKFVAEHPDHVSVNIGGRSHGRMIWLLEKRGAKWFKKNHPTEWAALRRGETI